MRLLNIGSGGPGIPLPPHYKNWQVIRLDVAKDTEPDILLDARQLATLPPGEYDAVYSSHFLEHFGPWELPGVLAGMRHVLKPGGWCEARVPDLGGLIRLVAGENLEMDAWLYDSPAGPIAVRDVIYGYAPFVQRSEFMQHKTGFSADSLAVLMKGCGFSRVWVGAARLEIQCYAFTEQPSQFAMDLLRLPKES